MLSRKNRINTELFKEVLKNGRVHNFNFFSLRVLKLPPQDENRFAFVAPKKIFKKAVQRNLLRRRGYNAVKNEFGKSASSLAAVFFLKKGAEELNFEDFKNEIKIALRKIKP